LFRGLKLVSEDVNVIQESGFFRPFFFRRPSFFRRDDL
jgi:hypothetical protein